MTILLLGAGGQLGRALQAEFPEAQAFTHADLDITTPRLEQVVRAEKPDIILNAAAYTAVDQAESESVRCEVVNRHAVATLAQIASELGALLVTYSTDYIFDGTKATPYEEDDAPAPLGVYGASKWRGEEAVRASGARHLIVRTSWLYSGQEKDFTGKILTAAKTRPVLRVVDDQIGQPTATRDLAAATRGMAAAGVEGTYHCVAQGNVSRYDWAKEIVALAGVACEIEAIKTAEMPTPATRPLNSRLSCEKLRRDTGIVLPQWDESLRNIMQRS